MKKIYFSLFVTSLTISQIGYANNARVTNAQRLTSDKTLVSFNLSWDHSWNVAGLPANHDACWVFIKFRQCGNSLDWNHGLLSTTMPDHTFAAGVTYAKAISVNDRLGVAGNHNTGVLIKRAAIGTGNIVNQLCTLKVTGGSGAVAFDITLDYDIRVFVIEMVQVPQSSFIIGDGWTDFALGLGSAACPDPACSSGIISSEGVLQVRHRRLLWGKL